MNDIKFLPVYLKVVFVCPSVCNVFMSRFSWTKNPRLESWKVKKMKNRQMKFWTWRSSFFFFQIEISYKNICSIEIKKHISTNFKTKMSNKIKTKIEKYIYYKIQNINIHATQWVYITVIYNNRVRCSFVRLYITFWYVTFSWTKNHIWVLKSKKVGNSKKLCFGHEGVLRIFQFEISSTFFSIEIFFFLIYI